MPTSGLLLPLHGDNVHNDKTVIQHLLNHGMAFDVRTNDIIVAPTLSDLPCGLYLMTEVLAVTNGEKAN